VGAPHGRPRPTEQRMNMLFLQRTWAVVGCLPLLLICAAGCTDDNNRVPTKAEMDQANVKRQSYIDSLSSLPPEAKAAMKSHMGGPPVTNPMDAAKAAADAKNNGPKDRR